MNFLDSTPDLPTKVAFLDTLYEVTEGKVNTKITKTLLDLRRS
jgi:hypothetical protein